MKRANVHGEVHFKQKQKLPIAFTGNTLPHRKQSCKSAEDFIVDQFACHRHATVRKMNSTTEPPRNYNKSKNKRKKKIDSQKLKYAWKHLSTETPSV